ncbi:MAG: type II toxin-antitoxin system RelE/ParE family toxin [Candidatus Korobacteraceae bacterium]
MLVRWTPAAVRDLTRICDYIEERNSAAVARRVALTIYDSIDSLAKFPYLGRPGRKTDTRELPFPGLPFVAIYRVRNEAVEVNRILHGAQSWP